MLSKSCGLGTEMFSSERMGRCDISCSSLSGAAGMTVHQHTGGTRAETRL